MDGINLPLSLDWFDGAVIAVVTVTVAHLIVNIANENTTEDRGFNFIFGTIVLAVVIILIKYNGIGIALYAYGLSTEDESGCKEAIHHYEASLHWNPKIAAARVAIIRCNSSLDKPEDSLTILEPLEDLFEESPVYWRDMAWAYYSNYEFDRMISSANRSVDLDHRDIDWLTDIGHTLMVDGLHHEAETVLRLNRTYYPENDRALFWLSWSLYEQEKYDDALNHFDQCIDRLSELLNDRLARCYAGKGFTYFALGSLPEARDFFIRSLTIDSNQPDVNEVLDSMES